MLETVNGFRAPGYMVSTTGGEGRQPPQTPHDFVSRVILLARQFVTKRSMQLDSLRQGKPTGREHV